MKRAGMIFVLLLLLILASGCTSGGGKKTEEAQTSAAQSAKSSDAAEEGAEEEKQNEKTSVISEQEARKLAWQVLNKHDWFLESKEEEYPNLNSAKDLEIGDVTLEASEIEYGFFALREKIPGKYVKYIYRTAYDETEEAYPVLCLYVNLKTKEVFEDFGISGVYKIPENDIVVYYPFAFDGYNDEAFLLQVLEKKKIIPNQEDYITSVGDFWEKMAEMSEEEMMDENTDEEVTFGAQEDGRIRLEVMEVSNRENIIGTYLIDPMKYTVTDEKTGKVIYKDPIPKYKTIPVTEKNAGEEALKILDQLGALDLPVKEYHAEVTGEIPQGDLEDWDKTHGYEVKITPKSKKAKPLDIQNYVLRPDGKVLYGVLEDEEIGSLYRRLYGNWLKEVD